MGCASRAAGAGIGQAVGQTRAQRGGKSRRFGLEERRGGREKRERRRLTAEGEMGRHAKGGEQRHAAGGEIRRGGAGEAGRQFEHEIRAVFKRGTRAKPLVMPGERAALGERAAHQAENVIRARRLAGGAQMIGMAEVKGVIFADDGADAHGGGLLSEKSDEKRNKPRKDGQKAA